MASDLKIGGGTDSRFDLLKFVMAIMVVAIHTGLYHNILMPWLRIAVPEFFILSSYFFFQKIDNAREINELTPLVKFIKRNIKLYLFWLIILLVPTLYLRRIWFTDGILIGLFTFAKNMIFGSTFVASWFISANILATIIVFYLRKHIRLLLFIGILAYSLQCIKTNYYYAFPLITNWLNTLSEYNPLILFSGIFSALIWIAIGSIFSRLNSCNSCNNKYLLFTFLAIASISLLIENIYIETLGFRGDANDCYFSLMLLCPSLLFFTKNLYPFYFRFSVILRRTSVIFFFVHGSFAFIPVLVKIPIFNSWNKGVASFTSTLLVCVFASCIILYYSKKGADWLKYLY